MKFHREVSNKKCCRLKHIFQAADVPRGNLKESLEKAVVLCTLGLVQTSIFTCTEPNVSIKYM